MNTLLKISCGGVLFTSLVLNACSSAPGKPKTYTVEIKDMKFVPNDIAVDKGDTVIWINRDMVPHDVTDSAKTWSSGPLATGASWKTAITDDADYYCSIHVVMKGKIELK